MTADITSVIISREDQVLVLSELDLVKNSLFSPGTPNLSPRTQPFWAQLRAQPDFSSRDLENIRVQILKMPVIRVTLAIEPSESFLAKMHALFSLNGKTPVILEWEKQTSLAAGVVYSVNGTMVDLSLVGKIQSLDLKPLMSRHLPYFSSLLISPAR